MFASTKTRPKKKSLNAGSKQWVVWVSKAVSKIQLNTSRNHVDVNRCRNYGRQPGGGSPGQRYSAVPVLSPCSRGPCAAKSDAPFTHRLQARGLCCCKGCETPLCNPTLNKVLQGQPLLPRSCTLPGVIACFLQATDCCRSHGIFREKYFIFK